MRLLRALINAFRRPAPAPTLQPRLTPPVRVAALLREHRRPCPCGKQHRIGSKAHAQRTR